MKKIQFLLAVTIVLLLTIACSGTPDKKIDNTASANHNTSSSSSVPVTDNTKAAQGSLSFKVNGTLYESRPETAGGFYTQAKQTGSFKGKINDNTSFSMSYKFDKPTGEIPQKFGSNYVNSPRLMLHGKVYDFPQHSYNMKVVVNTANEISKGVYTINGTFEGTVLDQDGKVVHTITDGKFTSPKNKVML
jgi:hypothetical protein